MAVVLGATGIFVYERQASTLNQAIDRSLQARATDVAALAQQSENGLSGAGSGADVQGANLAQIVTASGRVFDHSRGVPTRPLLSPAELGAARAGPVTIGSRQVAGRAVRLLAEPVRAQGLPLVVVVGQSLETRDHALAALRTELLIGGPLALLLASLAGYLLTGAALRPVEAMRRRAASISSSDLHERLPPAGANDELGRLGRTLNGMLERIEVSVARERAFVSDASHELRSPLATLRTELELIARDRPDGPALAKAVEAAIGDVGRLGRLADDMLLLSRADDRRLVLDLRPAAVDGLLHEAAERARRTAGPGAPTIAVASVGDERAMVDRDRIGQVLDNLLSNALRYATARVELSARAAEGEIELHVRDDGPGFPPSFLPEAWNRFARADAARTEDGAGLGLSIVRTIAEAHAGRTGAANRSGGGADVWIAIPAESAAVDLFTPGSSSAARFPRCASGSASTGAGCSSAPSPSP
jgi:signal transduction histidine kinase